MRRISVLLAGIIISLIVPMAGLFVVASPVAAATSAAATVDSPDIVVPSRQGQTVPQRMAARAQSSWSWYITRASGLIAGVTVVMLLLSGIGFITGKSFKLLEPLTAWATHKAIGIVFGISVLVHVLALLFDHYVTFNIVDILVPFASTYKPVVLFGINFGSLYVALGVIAMYILAAIIVTSVWFIDKRQHLWRWLHLCAYIVMIFVFIHALFLGTDLKDGLLRWAWIGLGVVVAIAMVFRFVRARLGKA